MSCAGAEALGPAAAGAARICGSSRPGSSGADAPSVSRRQCCPALPLVVSWCWWWWWWSEPAAVNSHNISVFIIIVVNSVIYSRICLRSFLPETLCWVSWGQARNSGARGEHSDETRCPAVICLSARGRERESESETEKRKVARERVPRESACVAAIAGGLALQSRRWKWT